MNSKGMQLAISTLIYIILGIAVLIGVVFFLTDGFQTFKAATDPIADSFVAPAIEQACEIACNTESKLTYCCNEFDFNEEKIKCTDRRLNLNCELSCEGFACT